MVNEGRWYIPAAFFANDLEHTKDKFKLQMEQSI